MSVRLYRNGGYGLLVAECRQGCFVTLNIKASLHLFFLFPFLFFQRVVIDFSLLGIKYRISVFALYGIC